MDPKACLQRMLDSLDDGNDHEAMAAGQDLLQWTRKGGAAPALAHRDFEALLCLAVSAIMIEIGNDGA